MNKTVALISLVAMIGFLIAGILFVRSNSLASQIQELTEELKTTSEELDNVEKELIFYKNTDLAKEVQLLQLKLQNAERDLTASLKEVTSLKNQVSTLTANQAKISPYLDAIQAMSDMFFGSGPTEKGVARIDAKIAVLKDASISDAWEDAKSGIDTERRSWGGESIGKTIDAILSRIQKLLAQ